MPTMTKPLTQAAILFLAFTQGTVTAWAQTSTIPPAGPIVSLEWLREHIKDSSVVVLAGDRRREQFERGHIPNARFVSHVALLDPEGHRLPAPGQLAATLSHLGADDNTRIVIYGDDPLSVGWVFVALASIGHGGHTSVLDGNYQAWRAAGYEAATGPSAGSEGRLTVRPAPDITVDRAWVRSHLKDPRVRLFDVRSPEEWNAGMIPNAVRLLYHDLYADVDKGIFKPPAAMRQLFERAGLKPDQTAVTYCAVGMRASLALFAARAAGIPGRVYTGSWADWSSDPTSPISRDH